MGKKIQTEISAKNGCCCVDVKVEACIGMRAKQPTIS